MSQPKKIKILICGVLPPPYFGHSMLYEMLMKSSFSSNYHVIFLNMHFWSYKTNAKITAHKILKLVVYFLKYVWLIIIHRPKYILYNISFYKMPFLKDFLFCATGIILGRRVMIHDHGQYVRELYASLSFWQKGMLRWMLKHAVGSVIMGEKVRAAYQGLMDDHKLWVVPGVVEDTKDLNISPNRPAEDFFNVLYFSHMSRSKGVFVAFEIASLLLQANRKIMISFGGPLENEDVVFQLEKLQKEYPERVHYLGYVENVKERAAIFRGADVFMFPTLRDVFGLVLLHAMAEGKPVVASREGTIPEIVIEGETGFLCEKGKSEEFSSKILELLSDEILRKKMSVAARVRFESFYSLEQYGQRMEEVFNHG